MNTWKLILATVLIFGTGVITGGLLVSHANSAKPKPLRPRTTAAQQGQILPPLRELPRRPEQELQRNLEQRRVEFILIASRELDLSPAQSNRIYQIIQESQERTRRLWEQVGPQMRKEPAEVKEKVRQELTPAQRRLFEELMKRQQTRRLDQVQPPADRAPREGREGRRPPPPRPDAPPGGVPESTPPPKGP